MSRSKKRPKAGVRGEYEMEVSDRVSDWRGQTVDR